MSDLQVWCYSPHSFSAMPKSHWTTLRASKMPSTGSTAATEAAVYIGWKIWFKSPWLVRFNTINSCNYLGFEHYISSDSHPCPLTCRCVCMTGHGMMVWCLFFTGWERTASEIQQHCGWVSGPGKVRCSAQGSQPRESHQNFHPCQSHLWLPADRGTSVRYGHHAWTAARINSSVCHNAFCDSSVLRSPSAKKMNVF